MSQGRNLAELTAAIRAVLPHKCRPHLDSWMENGTISLQPRDMGTGVNVGQLQYDAVFSIEALPFRAYDPAIVLAVVAAWLQDNDDIREQLELGDPQYVVTPNDDDTADLEITVTFSEPLRLVPDDNGPVNYGGKRWSVQQYDIFVAESGTITAGSLPPGPLNGGDEA